MEILNNVKRAVAAVVATVAMALPTYAADTNAVVWTDLTTELNDVDPRLQLGTYIQNVSSNAVKDTVIPIVEEYVSPITTNVLKQASNITENAVNELVRTNSVLSGGPYLTEGWTTNQTEGGYASVSNAAMSAANATNDFLRLDGTSTMKGNLGLGGYRVDLNTNGNYMGMDGDNLRITLGDRTFRFYKTLLAEDETDAVITRYDLSSYLRPSEMYDAEHFYVTLLDNAGIYTRLYADGGSGGDFWLPPADETVSNKIEIASKKYVASIVTNKRDYVDMSVNTNNWLLTMPDGRMVWMEKDGPRHWRGHIDNSIFELFFNFLSLDEYGWEFGISGLVQPGGYLIGEDATQLTFEDVYDSDKKYTLVRGNRMMLDTEAMKKQESGFYSFRWGSDLGGDGLGLTISEGSPYEELYLFTPNDVKSSYSVARKKDLSYRMTRNSGRRILPASYFPITVTVEGEPYSCTLLKESLEDATDGDMVLQHEDESYFIGLILIVDEGCYQFYNIAVFSDNGVFDFTEESSLLFNGVAPVSGVSPVMVEDNSNIKLTDRTITTITNEASANFVLPAADYNLDDELEKGSRSFSVRLVTTNPNTTITIEPTDGDNYPVAVEYLNGVKPSFPNLGTYLLTFTETTPGIFSVSSEGPLVEAYYDKLIDAVSSRGQQYVNTGIVGKTNTVVEIDMAGLSANANVAMFGAISSGNQHFQAMRDNNNLRFIYGSSNGAGDNSTPIAFGDGNRHLMRFAVSNSGQVDVTVDGVNKVDVASGITSSSAVPIYLFAGNSNGTASYKATMTLYGCRIWQDGRLMRNYRPCIKGNRAGLYDSVSHTITYSSQVDLIPVDYSSLAGFTLPEYVSALSKYRYDEYNQTCYRMSISNEVFVLKAVTNIDLTAAANIAALKAMEDSFISHYPPSVTATYSVGHEQVTGYYYGGVNFVIEGTSLQNASVSIDYEVDDDPVHETVSAANLSTTAEMITISSAALTGLGFATSAITFTVATQYGTTTTTVQVAE